jgi:hypothetical protein
VADLQARPAASSDYSVLTQLQKISNTTNLFIPKLKAIGSLKVVSHQQIITKKITLFNSLLDNLSSLSAVKSLIISAILVNLSTKPFAW